MKLPGVDSGSLNVPVILEMVTGRPSAQGRGQGLCLIFCQVQVGVRLLPSSWSASLWKGTVSLRGRSEAEAKEQPSKHCGGSEAWQVLLRQPEKPKLDSEKEATSFLLLRFLREVHHSFSREKTKQNQTKNQKTQPTKQKPQTLKSQTNLVKKEAKSSQWSNFKNFQKRTNVPYEKMGMGQKRTSTSVFFRTFTLLDRHFIFCTEKMV